MAESMYTPVVFVTCLTGPSHNHTILIVGTVSRACCDVRLRVEHMQIGYRSAKSWALQQHVPDK